MVDYNCRVYFVKYIHLFVKEDLGVLGNGDVVVFGNVLDFGVDFTMSISSPFFLSDNSNGSFMLGLTTWQGWTGAIGLMSLSLNFNQNIDDQEINTATTPENVREEAVFGDLTTMNVGFSSNFNLSNIQVQFGSLIMKRVSLSYLFIGSINCSSDQVYKSSQYPPICISCSIECLTCNTLPQNCSSCGQGKLLERGKCVAEEEQSNDGEIIPVIFVSKLGILPFGVCFMLFQIIIWLVLKKRKYTIDLGDIQAQPSISFS